MRREQQECPALRRLQHRPQGLDQRGAEATRGRIGQAFGQVAQRLLGPVERTRLDQGMRIVQAQSRGNVIKATAYGQRSGGEDPCCPAAFTVLTQRPGHIHGRALAAETTRGELVPEHIGRTRHVRRVGVEIQAGLVIAQPAAEPRDRFARPRMAGIQASGGFAQRRRAPVALPVRATACRAMAGHPSLHATPAAPAATGRPVPARPTAHRPRHALRPGSRGPVPATGACRTPRRRTARPTRATDAPHR
ncbi:hypothetical protein G6F50_014250 [Rhizopus delemar]|uniref:Uncharacterized protein n=1 Tax=Rhizopus delemar TaxID=936053 RepID=A0A9P6Y8K3_9FUNG|nr:hypothetical protein G6F50_014250 [Rhizopus delemar]